jgi:hypothetical protein
MGAKITGLRWLEPSKSKAFSRISALKLMPMGQTNIAQPYIYGFYSWTSPERLLEL